MRELLLSLLTIAATTAVTLISANGHAHAYCVYNRTTYRWLNQDVHLGPIGVKDARKQDFLQDKYFQAPIYYGDNNAKCCPGGNGECQNATLTTRGNNQPLLGPPVARGCSTPVTANGWVEITASQAIAGGPVTLHCIAHPKIDPGDRDRRFAQTLSNNGSKTSRQSENRPAELSCRK